MIDFTKSKYSPKVKKFLSKNPLEFKKLTLLDGSVRSGKTVSIIFKMPQIMDVLGNDGIYCFSGYSKNTVRTNVLNDLLPYLKYYHGANSRYNSQSGELDIKLWGKLYNCLVVGGGNAGSEATIQGGTWKFWYANELSKQHSTFCNMALTRLSAENAFALGDCNPENPMHWLYLQRILPLLDPKHPDHEKVKKVFEYWHFIMDDNHNLDPKYVEEQKSLYSGVFYNRKILGEWCIAEGLVFAEFDKTRHKISRATIEENIQKKLYKEFIGGCDWGYAAEMAAGVWGVTRDNHFHLIWEFYKTGKLTEDISKWFQSKQNVLNKKLNYIFCDSAEPDRIQELINDGLNAYLSEKEIGSGLNTVKTGFRNNEILICEDCVNTENELLTLRHPEEGEKGYGDDSVFIGKDHAADGILRYPIHSYKKDVIGL